MKRRFARLKYVNEEILKNRLQILQKGTLLVKSQKNNNVKKNICSEFCHN